MVKGKRYQNKKVKRATATLVPAQSGVKALMSVMNAKAPVSTYQRTTPSAAPVFRTVPVQQSVGYQQLKGAADAVGGAWNALTSWKGSSNQGSSPPPRVAARGDLAPGVIPKSPTTSVSPLPKSPTVSAIIGADAVKNYAVEQMKDIKLHDTGFTTYTNPNLDLAHLPASQRQAMMDTQTKRIYGGQKKDVSYLATSMSPDAIAWRAMQRAEGPVTKAELAGGGVGGRPVGGYKYIDISTPESVIKSIRTMPERQYADMISGREPLPPGYAGEGIALFGGKSPGVLSSASLAGYASAQHARRRGGKRKKQLAKRNIFTVDVGFNAVKTGINIPTTLGNRNIDLRKKRKK